MKITKDRLKDVMRGIQRMEKEPVYVGVPEKKTERKGQPSKQVTNAQIGYWMEYGVPSANIPARPWLIPGVKQSTTIITKRFRKAARAALDGNLYIFDQQVTGAGQDTVSTIKRRITQGIQPGLAESTLYDRKHRKNAPRTGETPLIDTGKFRNSITFVIKGKDGA